MFIQEVNIALSIEITLYNHKICLDVAHDTTDAAFSISFISALIHTDPAVSMAYAEPRFITDNWSRAGDVEPITA